MKTEQKKAVKHFDPRQRFEETKLENFRNSSRLEETKRSRAVINKA